MEVVGGDLVAEAAAAAVEHHHHLLGAVEPEGPREVGDRRCPPAGAPGPRGSGCPSRACRSGAGRARWRGRSRRRGRRPRSSRPPRCSRDRRASRSRSARPSRRRPAARRGTPAVEMRTKPSRPTPAGTSAASASTSSARRGRTSGQTRSVRTSRIPQLMSKPMPPGEITPARRVEGRDAADREAVAPVGVGHAEARLDDARQRRDVRGLHEHLVVHRRDQRLAPEDPHRHVHARPQAGRELEDAFTHALESSRMRHVARLAARNLLTSIRVPPIHARN